MPVGLAYIETGIVHVQWQGKVTIDELEAAVRQIDTLIATTGDAVFSEIVDLRACTMIPFNLRGLQRIATHDARISGYVVLQANQLAQTMARMLTQVAGVAFHMTTTWEEALAAARSIVRANQPEGT